MNAWLDDLSEDWVPPPSSPPSSSDVAGLDGLRDLPPRPKSRIPRYQNPTAPTSSIRRLQGRSLKVLQAAVPKGVLTERTFSENNISLPSESDPTTAPIKQTTARRSISGSSISSVVHHGVDVDDDIGTVAIGKGGRDHDTPEWRRRLLHGEMGYGDRKDLFSPIGLQNIFNKPDEDISPKRPNRNASMSFLKGVENIPSSPPPWPTTGTTKTVRESQESQLDVVHEDLEEQERSDTFEEPSVHSSAGTIQRNQPTEGSPSSEEGRNSDTNRMKQEDSIASSRVISGRTELNEGFSPVFISKHNTTDGRIDYAALELSKTELEQRLEHLALKNSSTSSTQQPTRKPVAHENSISQLQSEPLPDSILTGTPNSYDVGEFVSVRRGGYSVEGSFVHRPLSPSPMKEKDSLSTIEDHSISESSVDEPGIVQDKESSEILPIAPTPPRASKSTAGSQHSSARVHSKFGQGDLDSHGFEDGFTPQFEGSRFTGMGFTPAASPSPTMRPPGSKEPSKYHPSDMTGTFAASNKRKLSKLSAKSYLSIGKRSSRNQPVRTETSYADVDTMYRQMSSQVVYDVAEGKRPPTSPCKDPTPKRRRTLHLDDMENTAIPVRVNSRESSDHESAHSVIGRKRKDARYDDSIETVHPEVLARRQILRPRNPTPSQRRRYEVEEEILDATEAFMESSPRLQTIQEHLQSPAPVGTTAEEQQARAVASKVAAFTVKMSRVKQSERKKSVTTQDFLDEAMKIMSFIRNRGRASDGANNASLADSDFPSEAFDEDAIASTSLTFERPPSRENRRSGWRTRDVQQDPNIEEHLQRFQDDEDEDFMPSSIRSLHIRPSEESPDESYTLPDGEDILIRGPISRDMDSIGSEDGTGTQGTMGSNTQNSAQSSLGNTNVTTASKRSDNVATLAPEAVAHLIPEEIGCMTFDRDRGIWVKNKSPKKPPRRNADVSSINQSDDNVLDQIPDLSVNATDEDACVMSRKEGTLRQRLLQAQYVHGIDLSGGIAASEQQNDGQAADRPETREGASAPQVISSSVPSKYTAFASSVPQAETRATSWSDQSAASQSGTMKGPAPPPQSTVVEQDVEHEIGIEEGRHPNERVHNLRLNSIAVSFSSPRIGEESKGTVRHPDGQSSRPQSASAMSVSSEGQPTRARSTPPRQVNFSVAMTRPSSSPHGEIFPCQPGQQIADVTFLLSELPEFTINQVDERELPQRTLAKRHGHQLLYGHEDRFHEGNAALVKALQDVDPDEPFWEDLRDLVLDEKDLTSLNLLDLLCERVENLSVSNNNIAQLVGVPPSARLLNADRNLLTGLTTWGHLVNLQYLNVSNNDIEDLLGFNCLVHLRQLNADDNRITSLDGILGLDGLLELSLKGNRVRVADFTGSELKRLTKLNLAANGMEKFIGFETLPALVDLNLDDNELDETPLGTGGHDGLKLLRSLSIRRNGLTELPITIDGLNVENLYLDGNRLPRQTNFDKLKRLQLVSMRQQRPPSVGSNNSDEALIAAPDVQEMFLSLNQLPSMTMKQPFLNLRTLELASCGIQALPENFGQQAESLRSLNLNFNALKDLRPLLNIKRLEELHLAGNRLQRLRKQVAVLALLPGLTTLDLRDNPFSLGFYPSGYEVGPVPKAVLDGPDEVWNGKRFILVHSSRERDEEHAKCMDEDTKLRRRVYEMLVANNCALLQHLDGLAFLRKRVLVKDDIWVRLLELGVVRKSHRSNNSLGGETV
ncbi:hypothetical protein P152DRAFT_408215 [Eremomyces bilateralis CBS 781.70]|uniref:L domain-like protein n=1 Tax=Eremomyces bilateralis CBS 781.70 TaxID=1392243 RepID=A0A6G1GHQ3_9PEZI|nr:uncharacterized protein P152DRAFT_408215 [Eremomyces bilateralis CBS 781.70]KAF1817512.1 hypothetical protein P152DRAFT_408215 [Eremomyces bilateralis CBS 781.70]